MIIQRPALHERVAVRVAAQRQLALLRRQAAQQQAVAKQQQRMIKAQATQAKLARRRAGAKARRAEILAKRERTRQENLARAQSKSPQEELVSLRNKVALSEAVRTH